MLLIFVRRGETEIYRYLKGTLAEHAVYIAWDRRVAQRRQTGLRLPGDRRRRERRASRLSLTTLPFIVAAPTGQARLSA